MKAIGAEAGAQQAADCWLVLDHQHGDALRNWSDRPSPLAGQNDRRTFRERQREHRPRAIGPVPSVDRAAEGFDEAATDGKAEAGAGPAAVAVRAVEFREDASRSLVARPGPSSKTWMITLPSLKRRARR